MLSRRCRNAAPENERVPLSQLKAIIRRQAALLRSTKNRRSPQFRKSLPDDPGRRAGALSAIHDVISADGDPDPARKRDFEKYQAAYSKAGLAAKINSRRRQEA